LNLISAFSGYQYMLRQYDFFPDSYNLLQAKERTVADQYSVHTINPDMHLMCEVPATVNVYRTECRLCEVD
jgi:hypothetical protein